MNKRALLDAAMPVCMILSLVSASAQSTLGALHGRTVKPDGTPVAEARVVIRPNYGNTVFNLTSSADGSFQVLDLKPGRYQLKASKGTFQSLPEVVQVAALQDPRVDLALMASESIEPGVSLQPTSSSSNDISPAVAKELAALKARIDQLEAELKNKNAQQMPPADAAEHQVRASVEAPGSSLLANVVRTPRENPVSPVALARPAEEKLVTSNAAAASAPAVEQPQRTGQVPSTPTVDLETPFAFGDFTWLNGNPRTKESPLDTKYFTGEFRSDTHYMIDANQPRDHTLGGSTESFRSGEVQVEQMSIGGDLHVGNVRGRILTMFGLFATTTPRNDASAGVGQWDLRNAYRYVSEAWGGYHFNVNHGLNIDAGIFVSYIGLFSYYNFDNWAYQPSYVSSNTPWFFNGVRIQWFPTNKLKIEPWFINGWQSYARFNGHHGLGGQILWRPKEWISIVSNNYGNGTDTLGNPNRFRIHTDNSVEIKYYDNPNKTLDKMAISITGDLGCEYGGGVTCHGGKGGPKQAFLGWMAYNRFWFKKDLYGVTLGGGMMNNPGRYLTLLPPINGADAVSGSPYFTANPGDKYHAWDASATFDWMPKQFITFRFEAGYRHADVPYWSGRGGITPPGGNTGNPTQLVILPDGTTWRPDLRRGQFVGIIALLVKI